MAKVVVKEKQEEVLAIPEEKIQEYKEAFDMFDVDKSGHITANELFKVMKNMGNDLTLKEIKQMIAELDEDGSGEIGFNEFITFIKRTQVHEEISEEEEVLRAFQTFDKDGTGSITCAEFKYILTSLGDRFTEQEVEEVFKEADLDHDGNLDYNEFVDFWKNR
jgi:calmodulin